MGGEPRAIPPARAVPGTQVWEGEVFGTSSGGHLSDNRADWGEFTVKAIHPFDRRTFGMQVGSSTIDFCGVNKEMKDLDLNGLNYR
jgi:hypothetical protein